MRKKEQQKIGFCNDVFCKIINFGGKTIQEDWKMTYCDTSIQKQHKTFKLLTYLKKIAKKKGKKYDVVLIYPPGSVRGAQNNDVIYSNTFVVLFFQRRNDISQ